MTVFFIQYIMPVASIVLLIWCLFFLRKEFKNIKKNEDLAHSIRTRYPDRMRMMITSRCVIIFLVEDGKWVDSSYIDQYIRERNAKREIRWQKVGF